MTEAAKKTGDELIKKFYTILPMMDYEDEHNNNSKTSIQCAIITVEYTIKVLEKQSPNYEQTTYWHPIDFQKEILTYLKSL